MVYPDIDFSIQTEQPDIQAAIELVPAIFNELATTALKVANLEKDVYYIGFDFPFNDKTWHIDATITKPGPIVTNPPELAEWLKAMTDAQRQTILTLKQALIDSRRYVGSKSQPPYTFRSSHLYEGVIVGGAKSIEDLENFTYVPQSE